MSSDTDAGKATRAPAHLILVGLPGSGKSSVGAAVAQRINWPFLDFDAEIERQRGMTVPQIFAQFGESEFRRMEVALTNQLRNGSSMVLAPGGGWIGNSGVVAMLRPPSRIVHLRVSPATALHRLGKGQGNRPLLQNPDPLAALKLLNEKRAELYRLADAEIDTETMSLQQVIEEVAQVARYLVEPVK